MLSDSARAPPPKQQQQQQNNNKKPTTTQRQTNKQTNQKTTTTKLTGTATVLVDERERENEILLYLIHLLAFRQSKHPL